VTGPDGARSDAELLAAARAGSRDAIEALAARYQARVFRLGVRMCGHPEDGRDVAQETLLAMARSIGSFRGDAELTTWLYTIARRACTKVRRRRRTGGGREESLDALDERERDALASSGRDPERALETRELTAVLDAALAALPAAQREVLVLRDIEGLTAAETAKVLGLGVAAVKSRLHRARRAVQVRMRPVLGPAPTVAAARPCPDVLAMFSRHLEGELAAGACDGMQAHLKRCGRCDAVCRSLERVLALCRAQTAPAVPPRLEQSIRRAVRAYLDVASPAAPGRPAGRESGSRGTPRSRQ
jgi:RNA polymerase sigma-70 factor (ECF subfamily)